MATANQIRINTGIDTSAISKGIAKLKQELDDLNQSTSKSAQKALELEGLEKRIQALKSKLDSGYGSEDEAEDYRIMVSEADKLRAIIQSLNTEEQNKKGILADQIQTLEKQKEILMAIQAERSSDELNGKSRTVEQYQSNVDLLEQAVALTSAISGEDSDIVKSLQNELTIQKQLLEAKSQEKVITKENAEVNEYSGKGIKNILRSVKTLTLSLIGARSVYIGIRKVISEATSENQKLSNTIQAFWSTLGTLAQPAINWVISGLANILSYIISIFSYLTGINLLAKVNAKLAKKSGSNSKKNNLASFDTSEVLKKDDDTGVGASDNLLKQIELGEKLKAILDLIKNALKELIEWWNSLEPGQKIAVLIASLLTLISVVGILKGAWEALNWVFALFDGLLGTIVGALTFALGLFISLYEWTNMMYSGFDNIKNAIMLLGIALMAIGAILMGAPALVATILATIFAWILEFTISVKEEWNDSLTFGQNIMNCLVSAFEKLINGIITGLNWLIDQINKISFDVPEWVPEIGGKTFGFNLSHVNYVSIPRPFADVPALAKGAVLPPNKPFMAMLGDQRNGANLEAPEDLIRQIVREESGSGEVNIIADGSLSQFIKMIRFELQKEDKRVGTNLVMGG